MRYLVIAECVDLRTDKRFQPGDEFLPEPDPRQATKLVEAGCIAPIPDSAPPIPNDDLDGKSVKQLQDVAKAERVDLGTAKTADAIVALIRAKRASAPADLGMLDHDALLKVAAAEQVEIADGADDETIRNAIADKRAKA